MNLKISQNFSKFPWDPVKGLDSIQTVCLQLNPIGGSQGNPEKSREILKFADLNRVNFREMAFNLTIVYKCLQFYMIYCQLRTHSICVTLLRLNILWNCIMGKDWGMLCTVLFTFCYGANICKFLRKWFFYLILKWNGL